MKKIKNIVGRLFQAMARLSGIPTLILENNTILKAELKADILKEAEDLRNDFHRLLSVSIEKEKEKEEAGAREPSQSSAAYGSAYKQFEQSLSLKDSFLSGWFNDSAGELTKGFKIIDSDIVVDVGCGDGGNAAFCSRFANEVIYCDIDQKNVDATEKFLAEVATCNYSGITASGDSLPIESGLASKILCMEVLEHVDSPEDVLAELARIGNGDCRYLLTVPSPLGEDLQKDIAPGEYFEHPNHIRIFQDGELRTLLESSGFVVEEEYNWGFYQLMWWTFFWTDNEKIMYHWSQLWENLLEDSKGLIIKHALDRVMPKSLVIIASKKPSID